VLEGPLNVGFRLGRKRSISKAFNANTTYITMLIKVTVSSVPQGVPAVDLTKARRQRGAIDLRQKIRKHGVAN
jgi:hypothetical protein